MTASKREQILAAITTSLAGTTGVGSRIYRSRVEAFARNEAPAIVVEGGRETAATYSTCKLDWSMDVLVAIYARGNIPDQLADPVRVSAHANWIGQLIRDIAPGVDRHQHIHAPVQLAGAVGRCRLPPTFHHDGRSFVAGKGLHPRAVDPAADASGAGQAGSDGGQDLLSLAGGHDANTLTGCSGLTTYCSHSCGRSPT